MNLLLFWYENNVFTILLFFKKKNLGWRLRSKMSLHWDHFNISRRTGIKQIFYFLNIQSNNINNLKSQKLLGWHIGYFCIFALKYIVK